jgi:hypothetical protein
MNERDIVLIGIVQGKVVNEWENKRIFMMPVFYLSKEAIPIIFFVI